MNGQNGTLIAHIRKLTDAHVAARQEDAQLLERFVRMRDEAAFEALIQRHGPMVLRVCRRALGHAQDAEDVFQATFLLLSRKAASLRDRAGVGSWLFGVASRLARKARTAARRRAAHEARAPMRIPGSADPSLAETQALLDEELALLPEKYRSVLILCYLQGLTRDEAAGRLGLSLAGVKKRLERGRERLRARLARRGIPLSAVLLGLLLASEGLAAVPSPLVAATVGAAQALAQGKSLAALGAGPGVLLLYRRGLMIMFLRKLKFVGAVALAVVLAVLSGGLAYQVAAGAPVPEPRATAPVPQPKPAEAAKPGARTVPVGVPLEARLVGKTAFPLDLNGLTPQQFRDRIKPGPVVPNQAMVDLQLQVTNTGDQPLRIQVGGTVNQLTLDLKGPGAVTIPALQRRLGRPVVQPPREVVVKPGETVTVLEIPRLISSAGLANKLIYWTEPGDYQLTAEYKVLVSPAPTGTTPADDGFAPVTLATSGFSFKVEGAGQ